jgi:hypothetical protein
VNQYLAESPQARKGAHFGQQAASVGTFSTLTLAETVQQGIDRLQIASGSGFEAYLEGVAFEDYSFVGSPRLREALIRQNNLIH